MRKKKSSTALVPDWYVEFQTVLLRQVPRPGEIDQVTAEGWTSNQKSLKKELNDCLVPPTKKEVVCIEKTDNPDPQREFYNDDPYFLRIYGQEALKDVPSRP